MRLVLDTNVLLTALMSPSSASAEILSLWRDRKVVVLTAPEQLDEIGRVTRYPRIRARLHPAVAGRLVNRLRNVAVMVNDLPKVDRSPDPDDNYLLALSEAGQADYLVTGGDISGLLALGSHKRTRIVPAEDPSPLTKIVTPNGIWRSPLFLRRWTPPCIADGPA